jgi:transposase
MSRRFTGTPLCAAQTLGFGESHSFGAVKQVCRKGTFLKLGWVPTVPNPSVPIRELRTLLQARDNLVGLSTNLKHRGHGALTRPGILTDAAAVASARGRQRLAATAAGLPEADRHLLLVVLQQLEGLEQAIATLARLLPISD